MKSVLISIRPKWVAKIASGEKTIEVRKSAPKEVPFKCYIYCTFPKKPVYTLWLNRGTENRFLADGKVIGEFICRGIMQPFDSLRLMAKESCLTEEELVTYSNGKLLYGWRISDLKIYDKPKEWSEFRTPKNPHRIGNSHSWILDGYKKITRPPQSWQYVEEV